MTDTQILMIINALVLALTSILTFLARNDVAKAKISAEKTADSVQKIEVHTNGERTATLKLLEDLRREMLVITKENSMLKEQRRGDDLAKASSSGRVQGTQEELS